MIYERKVYQQDDCKLGEDSRNDLLQPFIRLVIVLVAFGRVYCLVLQMLPPRMPCF